MSGASLAGRGVVVTRPRNQARGLIAAIESCGGRAFSFPGIEIEDLPDMRPVLALIDRLDEYDLAIFISPTAVRKAVNLMRLRRGEPPFPAALQLAAIGRGSRRELEALGARAVLAPEAHADSEALLSHPALAALAGQRIVIFRGEGGREALAEGLRARGARVDYADCYRRAKPRADAGPLLASWARGEVHAVTLSSAEGLANFYELIGALGRQWLRAVPVFAAHPRIAEEARRRGLERVVVAGPGDDETLAALVAYFRPAK